MESAEIGPKQRDSFRKFFQKLPHGKDITLVILKGHLLLEEQIRAIVDERLTTPSALKDSRLDCHQVICLAEALCPKSVDESTWKAAKKLNRIRNDVAHNLDPNGLNDRILDFADFYPSIISTPEDSTQEKFEKSLLSLFVSLSILTDKKIEELI